MREGLFAIKWFFSKYFKGYWKQMEWFFEFTC